MKTYRNRRTGATVETNSTVAGDEWELVKPEKQKKAKGTDIAKNETGTGETGEGAAAG